MQNARGGFSDTDERCCETRMPSLSLRLAFSATDRNAVQRKRTSVTSCHSPLCLERWLTATVKPARPRHFGCSGVRGRR
jgi:hypothetical protein